MWRKAGAGEDEGIEQDAPEQAMDIAAFAMVSLVDDAGLMGLFKTQSTYLHFVERGDSTGRLPPLEDRTVRISLLHIGENRMVKLGEDSFYLGQPDGDDPQGKFEVTPLYPFVNYEEEITLHPFIHETLTSGESRDTYAAILDIDILDFHEEVMAFEHLLELWRFLEICLTGQALRPEDVI